MNSLEKFILGSIYCNNLTNVSNPVSIIPYLKNKMDLDNEFYLGKIIGPGKTWLCKNYE